MGPLRRGSSRFWSTVGEMSSLALTLALCVLIGFLVGRWIGKRLGHEDVGVLGGMAVGIAAAGVELARSLRRLRQALSERDENSADKR